MAELEPVDAVEVTLVVDNYVDILMAGAEGAVNVLGNAKRLTGRDRIAGFVGGFHLTGAIFEPVIDPTITAFTELGSSGSSPATAPAGRPPTASPRPCRTPSSSPRWAPCCGRLWSASHSSHTWT